MGSIHGWLAIGTIGQMVISSAMIGLSVAGMAIGATIALPELLRGGYDKIMVTGAIPVPYTHLPLPTTPYVSISVVAVSVKKKHTIERI